MTSSLPITTAILGVTAIVFAANASAADLPPYPHDAPVVRGAPVYGWQGAYVGLAGGGSWGRSKHVDRVTGLDDTPVFNVNGGVFGATAGYNWQLMSWIFGAEGDLYGSVKKAARSTAAPPAMWISRASQNCNGWARFAGAVDTRPAMCCSMRQRAMEPQASKPA